MTQAEGSAPRPCDWIECWPRPAPPGAFGDWYRWWRCILPNGHDGEHAWPSAIVDALIGATHAD